MSNKEKRRDLENSSKASTDWLNQFTAMLEIAVGHKDEVAQAEQKKVREEAARFHVFDPSEAKKRGRLKAIRVATELKVLH